jgi:hypothetical protein
MPRLRRPAVSALWSLLGDKQTSHGQPISVALDPDRASPTLFRYRYQSRYDGLREGEHEAPRVSL